jgi:hypothetical protein
MLLACIVQSRDQEVAMKSMARAILFTGFVAATTAAVGDMLTSAMGETDNQAAANGVPVDPQASDPTMTTESAASTEGAAADLAASSTYVELQPGDSMTVTPSPSTDIVAAAPPPAESVAPAPRPTGSVARRMPARTAYQMTVASAFPSSVDDAGHRLVARITHADLYGNASVMTAGSAFPSSVDDAGYRLVARTTFADLHLGKSVQVAQADRRLESSSGN